MSKLERYGEEGDLTAMDIVADLSTLCFAQATVQVSCFSALDCIAVANLYRSNASVNH